MARTVLSFSRPEEDRIIVIDFDAIELESPRAAVEITEYPVEQGTPLVDHVRLNPVSMRLRGFVTDAPMRADAQHMDGLQRFQSYGVQVIRRGVDIDPISGIRHLGDPIQVPPRVATVAAEVRVWRPTSRSYVAPTDFAVHRVVNVYGLLIENMQRALEFTLVSEKLGIWDHMLIKSLSTDRDEKSGTGLSIDIEMVQVEYGILNQAEISGLLPPKPANTKPAKPRSQPAKSGDAPASPADEKTKRSILKELQRQRQYDALQQTEGPV